MIGLAIVGLVVLFYLLVAYFAAKTWQVGHVVVLVGLFLGSMGFLVLAAATLKTQARWRQEYQQTEADLARALQLQERLEHGDPNNPDEPGLRRLKGLVKRESFDRGRVWRNLKLAGIAPEALTLSTVDWGNEYCLQVGRELGEDEVPEPLPDPDAVAAEEGQAGAPAGGPGGRPHGIRENAIVHAFKEYPVAMLPPAEKDVLYGGNSEFLAQDRRGMCRVPLAYLGRYRVAQSNDQAVVLSWTEPPDDTQRRLLQAQDGGTWVLYESLAQDSHDVFEGLSPEQVQALFPVERHQQMGLALSPERYGLLMRRYARDKTPAQPTDRPEQLWMRVKFVKEYPIENVDVSVEGELPPADRPFTPGGQAQVARLMLDKEHDKMKLEAGDEALLPLKEASSLVEQGIGARGEVVYLRDLRDYEFFFNAAHEALVKLHDQIGVAERENASLVTSNDQLSAQITGYEEERTLLDQDLGGFRQELEQLSRYRGALQRRFEHLRSEINRLHLANTRAASTAGDAATLPQRALTPVASTSSLPPR